MKLKFMNPVNSFKLHQFATVVFLAGSTNSKAAAFCFRELRGCRPYPQINFQQRGGELFTQTSTKISFEVVKNKNDIIHYDAVPKAPVVESQIETPFYDALQFMSEETNDIGEKDGSNAIIFARLLLLTVAALYGTNFSAVKILDEHIPVGAMSSLRFGLASLVTLPFMITSPLPEKSVSDSIIKNNRQVNQILPVMLKGMEVGMWIAIGYIAQAIGLETTDASKSAFICSLAIVFVPMLDVLVGKIMPLHKVFGAILAVLGVGLLELGEFSDLYSFTLGPGDTANLIQPIAFGIGFWRMEQALRAYPNQAMRLTASQILAVALSSFAFCAFGLDGHIPPSLSDITAWISDPMILGALLWTGVCTTAVTTVMENTAMKSLSAAETTLIYSTEPLWGSLFASMVFSETFGMNAGIGALLILAGCAMRNFGFGKKENKI